jgi:hypothetical protein
LALHKPIFSDDICLLFHTLFYFILLDNISIFEIFIRDVDKRENEEIYTLRIESERFGRWKKWLSVSPCTAYKGQIIETLFRLQSGKITHPPPLAPRGAQGPQGLLPEEGAGWHIAR